MKRKIDPQRDPEMLLVGMALQQRAAKRARTEARRTGTPLIVHQHGTIIEIRESPEKGKDYSEKNEYE